MDQPDELARRFEESRSHLQAVALRMLGSVSEAEDAVQDAWLKLSRSETGAVENLTGWLTTVVARVCLDQLRARKSRREESAGEHLPDASAPGAAPSPEQQALLADSVGLALLTVLETLAPAERLAFVLHDLFALPFDEIAAIAGCSPVAARQLASRARRRVQGAAARPDAEVDRSRQREVVDAFLAASRGGDLAALLAVLDPGVVLRADRAAVETSAATPGAPKFEAEIRGAAAVARTFSGSARAARPALVDGSIGLAWAPGGVPRAAFRFTVVAGKITSIEVVVDPAELSRCKVELLE
jgi:RNA polymerase sigma factor (sigma-70 family)